MFSLGIIVEVEDHMSDYHDLGSLYKYLKKTKSQLATPEQHKLRGRRYHDSSRNALQVQIMFC